jgi:hypothetical protein
MAVAGPMGFLFGMSGTGVNETIFKLWSNSRSWSKSVKILVQGGLSGVIATGESRTVNTLSQDINTTDKKATDQQNFSSRPKVD